MSRTLYSVSFPVTGLLFALSACLTTLSAMAAEGVQQLTTPEGHKYWYLAMPEAERNALAMTWNVDVPTAEDVHPVTAIVGIDLMLNGGAGGKDPTEIFADFEDLDAGSRLWVQPREISGFVVAPEVHMDKAGDIANLVLTKPNFDKKWFDRERGRIAEDASNRDNNVWGLAWNLARVTMFNQHPYNQFWSLRPAEDMDGIDLEDIKAWHAQAFSNKVVTIAAAGNAPPEKMASQIDQVLNGMPKHEAAEFIEFPEPDLPTTTILLHQPDAEKSAVLLIGLLPESAAKDVLSLQLGIGVLGHGKQSRLFKAIRTGLRASYGFGAEQFRFTRAHRMLQMSGEIETAKLQDALTIIEETYEEFREEGIGRVEFPIAKKFYKREMNKQLTDPVSVAMIMMETRQSDKRPEHVTTLVDQIDSMERGTVNKIVRDTMPSYAEILKIVVTPDKDAIKGACIIDSIDNWENCI